MDLVDASAEDSRLVRRSRGGDMAAFADIYHAHAPRVRAYFRRSGFSQADSDDQTQDVFLRAFKSLAGFDGGRGTLGQWIGAIARNVARKRWQRRTAEHVDAELAEAVFAADLVQPGRQAQVQEEIAGLRECIERLPGELADLVRLRYVSAMTTRGMAASAELAEATVRLRLERAVDALRKCMDGKGLLDAGDAAKPVGLRIGRQR